MNVYDVFLCVNKEGKEIIKRCIRDLHGEERRDIRELYEMLTVSFPKVDVENTKFAMLGIVCPDKVCRVFAIDTTQVDAHLHKDTVSMITNAPDLQTLSFPKLLGMEIVPGNVIEVGFDVFAEGFLRSMMPGSNPVSYWTPQRSINSYDEKLEACVKHVLAQYCNYKKATLR